LQPAKAKWLAAGAISCIFYWGLAYHFQRTDTAWLQLSFAVLFIAFLFLRKADLSWVIGFGILFRLLFLFSIPALSDDFYRFIWDGLLWHESIHPFTHIPSYYMEAGNEVPGLSESLYNGLNSKDYFTVYPTFHQLVFWLSTFGYNGTLLEAIVPMRLILIGAEIALLLLLVRWMKKDSLPIHAVALYALNPLIIIEVSGNLHFEGLMALFLVLSVYQISKGKLVSGSLALAASIATKLTPVIAGPALMFAHGKKNWWKVVLLSALGSALLFLPLISSQWLAGQGESLDLYFRKFEFNASIYYLLREVGFWWKGYNIIATLGPRLAMAGGVLILLVSWLPKSNNRTIWQTLSIVFFIYYLAATTVHPWYVIPLVALSVFSGYVFPLVWSYTILWSYLGYNSSGYEIQWWSLVIEYLLVVGVFVWEVVLTVQTKQRFSNFLKK